MSILKDDNEMNNFIKLMVLFGAFAYIFFLPVPYDKAMQIITLLIGYVLGRFRDRVGRQGGF